MSMRELKRAGVLARVAAETLTLRSAAALMAVSYRQAKRLYQRYRKKGAAGLRHGSAGQASNRATSARRRKRVLALVREKYSGGVDERFGPTLAAEHLASEDRITVDHETLRRWMLAVGLWSRARKRSPHRRRRERKAHLGCRSRGREEHAPTAPWKLQNSFHSFHTPPLLQCEKGHF